ncbi:sensor histidine kinase [Priestia flexa]|jgi:two-component system, OmpR family, sensor histidine kinase YxdK|uniref:sensor histidine kinase n=1 Tax=Priestia flexa TaxID=86664 RepID=UPI000E6893EA|nr:sensor histidine kinase [Priestia flexa]MBN8434896.1 sensor histidine kinase [Priestia flexa]MCA0967674.1 sensor histidine kinase [Priestia flexa]RIV13358.1 sensor histidine kinase [Priestia flexa]UIR28838.1 sensor histidine kinase [Priestia flexa]UZW67845.1 sensor histidine kinase [Priestia flexa]
MKLFFKEHLPLTFFYLIQLGLVCTIFALDGFRDIFTVLYAILISTVIYITYLCYRYYTNKTFYKHLSNPLHKSEDSILSEEESPLSEALKELLESQFRSFHNEMYHYQNKLNQHITFMNQWVHQMKTPVSVIHLMIQNEDEPIFMSIQDEMDRIQKGLETVLYTSRLNDFTHDFQAESVSLHKVVTSLISSYKRFFIRNRVFPTVNVPPQYIVASDEKWIHFACSQLITNAVRYSAGINQSITISAFERGRQVILEVKDQGIGIPSQDLKRVFDPYFTGENGRKYQESTGMGLYLVKEICKQLHHQIELESKEGQGTTIRLIFQQNIARTQEG